MLGSALRGRRAQVGGKCFHKCKKVFLTSWAHQQLELDVGSSEMAYEPGTMSCDSLSYRIMCCRVRLLGLECVLMPTGRVEDVLAVVLSFPILLGQPLTPQVPSSCFLGPPCCFLHGHRKTPHSSQSLTLCVPFITLLGYRHLFSVLSLAF